MPKLLIFAPCEKVIIDQSNNPSLIGVIQGLMSPLPAQTIVPKKSMGLMRWDIFTLWQREEGDGEREYVQECQLIDPDGSTTIQASIRFKFIASTHRNIMSMYGFPLGDVGDHLLKLWLRDPSGTIREIASFPLTISREGKQ
jgi:hypothetical protein